MPSSHILVVEDDTELRGILTQRLEESGYRITSVDNGRSALEAVQEEVPDLVLLDVMIPEVDGLEVCRQLRASHPLIYVIMLTARTEEIDRVVGLEVGADDYVTKPFSLSELVARVRSAFRRIRLTKEESDKDENVQELFTFPGIKINTIRRRVDVNGSEIKLTVLEYDLLLFLVRNPDRPFTRLQLLDKVWNIQYEGYDRTVDSHIQRLRSKVEKDQGNPQFIKTVWGVGYKFQTEEDGE